MGLTNKEILRQFKHSTIKDVVERVLEDVRNFEFEKGTTSGYSINVWMVKPLKDEGSFLYYENEEDRDSDWTLLMGLVEAKLA